MYRDGSSRIAGGFRCGDGGLLLRGGFDAESDPLVRVRGPHVPRDLSGLLCDRRHVPDESQVREGESTRFSGNDFERRIGCTSGYSIFFFHRYHRSILLIFSWRYLEINYCAPNNCAFIHRFFSRYFTLRFYIAKDLFYFTVFETYWCVSWISRLSCFRVMAAALSLTMGRLGALVGNLVFGYLIDLACVVPIILFAAFLFGKILHLPIPIYYVYRSLWSESIIITPNVSNWYRD